MANMVKYSGICETCDHDQSCLLKRIPHLEIIECEHFCTHTVVNNVSAVTADTARTNAAKEDPAEIMRVEK